MSRYKVVITDFRDPDIDMELEELRALAPGCETLRLYARTPEEIIPHVADADALIVQFAPVNRQVIATLQRCRIISRYGIGLDMIDIPAATEKGIMVANVPDYCVDEVSTSTLANVLCLNRHLISQDRLVHSGTWGYPKEAVPARLRGQVLGVVALGNIGRDVARKALGLGLRVIAYDPYIRPDLLAGLDVRLVALEELLRTSDYVTLHCPLTPETHHLIGAAQLALMKRTAYLINMSRGPVVDQEALYRALATHTIAGAALDVLEREPPAPDEPLLKLDNVILTAHNASVSDVAVEQMRRDTARNVVVALQGGIPRSVVNRRELGLT